MQIHPKAYCVHCGEMRKYRIKTEEVEVTVRDVTFTYPEHQAICKRCGNQVYVPAINDNNFYERHKAYHDKTKELIENE